MNDIQLKRYFWMLLNLVLAAFLVNLVVFVMPTLKKFGDSFHPARTIMISADGKSYVVPDIAETSFSVISEGQNPATLADQNNQKITAAIDFVKGKGINAKDIRTTGYNLSPRYEYDEPRRTSFISGYTLTQTVTVKIRDFSKINEVIGGLPGLGINQIGGVSFSVDDPEKFLTEARTEAFAKVREKADAMARASGIRLGRIINVYESQGGYIPPYFGRGGEKLDMAGAPIALPTIEPGTEELTLTVQVTYAIE